MMQQNVQVSFGLNEIFIKIPTKMRLDTKERFNLSTTRKKSDFN